MKTIKLAYKRLLADVAEKEGCPLDFPFTISDDWALKEGPMLDKQLLKYLEDHGRDVASVFDSLSKVRGLLSSDAQFHPDSRVPRTTAVEPSFPEWLMPLWEKCKATLYAEDGPRCLASLRQVLVFCYKVETKPTNEQLNSSQEGFVRIDQSLCKHRYHCDTDGLPKSRLLRTARSYIGHVIGRIHWDKITPSHGPGSVFPSSAPSEKSRPSMLYPSIEKYYNYYDYFCGLPSHWGDAAVAVTEAKVQDGIRAKLIAVPKDSRGPRLICVHPKESIWIQQGQRHLLESAINRSSLAKGKISFKDQTVNGTLALVGSATRIWCTLDLKEASDRVSCQLVRRLFGDYAYDVLSCSRATEVELLNKRIHRLQKWAPMGNALCFPVESLVFWALVRSGIYHRHGVICDEVHVFGDDCIFPSKYYDGALIGLTNAGLVPNMRKTFRTGFFRESCGVDAFNGIDVTPVYARVAGLNSDSDVTSWLATAKQLRMDGREHCASYMYATARSVLKKMRIPLPMSNNSETQGWVEYVVRDLGWLMANEPSVKWRAGTQVWAVPCRLVSSRSEPPASDAWWHLLDSLLRISRIDGPEASERGTEYLLPNRERLSFGWSELRYRA